MKRSPLFILLLAAFLSCDQTSSDRTYTKLDKILVPNYGFWGSPTSSLSAFIYQSDSVVSDIYQSNNNGKSLGKGAQSVYYSGHFIYICLVDESKIVVLNPETLKEVHVLDLVSGSGPNYMTKGSDGLIYVTDVYRGKVIVINESTWNVVTEITVGSNPWHIISKANYLFVSNSGYGADSTISVIDPKTSAVIKTVPVDINPTHMIALNNHIVVQCSGNFFSKRNGSFWMIDPFTLTISDSLFLTYSPYSEMSVSGSQIYFSHDGVKRIDVSTGKLKTPTQFSSINAVPFFDHNEAAMYGIKTDDLTSKGIIFKFLGNAVQPGSGDTLGIFPSGSVALLYKTYQD